MTTHKLFAMSMLAVLALATFSETVMAQGPDRSQTRFSKATVRPTTVPMRAAKTFRTTSFSDAVKFMAPYRQWMIGANKTGFVYPKSSWDSGSMRKNYNLKSTAVRKFLQYEKQGTGRGINLGWTDNASADTAIKRSQWFFSTPHGSGSVQSPIVYGEPIAIAWGSRSKPFVKYSKRTIGINLNWSSQPSYEWVILGGQPGTKVRRGEDFIILYNLKSRQPLIYYDRTVGGHIGWPSSSRWGSTTIPSPQYREAMDSAVDALRFPEGNG